MGWILNTNFMNRIIKFRGKRIDGSEWVYGGIYVCPIGSFEEGGEIKKCYIISDSGVMLEVIPESVGQFIGLSGKNMIEAYEKDVVVAWSAGSKGTFEVRWRQEGSPCYILYPAWQHKQFWHIAATKHEKGKQFIDVLGNVFTSGIDGYIDDGLEIIGNTYDSPELIIEAQNPERSVATDQQ